MTTKNPEAKPTIPSKQSATGDGGGGTKDLGIRLEESTKQEGGSHRRDRKRSPDSSNQEPKDKKNRRKRSV